MYNEKKEIEALKIEQEISNVQIEAYKDDMIDSLIRRNLGDEIKNTLNNPIKITRFKFLKMRLSGFFKKLFDVL
jgi:hypothetical protein